MVSAAVGVGLLADTAQADINGAGPDETIQQAYGPLVEGVTYSGAFTDPNDVDYLAFNVTSAGQSLVFTVSNTLTSCNSPDDDSCPVYATLMDQSNQQVGGDNSSAGTIATVDDTETIDWTFAQPGTYYVLMESNGNLPPGQPTYTVSVAPAPSGSGSGSGKSPVPPVKSVAAARHQRGDWVVATVALAQPPVTMTAYLFARGRGGHLTHVASSTRRLVRAGTFRLALRLPAAYRRTLKLQHRLSVVLDIAIVTSTGRRLRYSRPVTLTG